MSEATVFIERGIAGTFRVATEPDEPLLRRRFWSGKRNARFSGAAGYASRLASIYEASLVDRTGRLSPGDCESLVKAHAGATGTI